MAAPRHLAGEPPESTRRRTGAVYERDDSLKENTNPKNHPGHGNGNGVGASQRFSGNLKPTAAPIIAVSGKFGLGCARRHHPPPPAMFPRKAKTGGGRRDSKPAVPEPASPKVSCIGKVLSSRQRDRCHLPRSPEMRDGCCPGLGFLICRSRLRKSAAVECVDWSPPLRLPLSAVARQSEAKEVETEEAAPVPAPAPALGGMRRFVSGRRAADWAAEMEEDGHVARSRPL